MWYNITRINLVREAKGLPTFSYRPHCGESGRPSHLIAGFLLSDGINHGITLRDSPPLEYLYYIEQVSIQIF